MFMARSGGVKQAAGDTLRRLRKDRQIAASPKWFTDAVAAPVRHGETVVEDCPIHYMEWGERGRPGLMLVHGGAAHAHWWSFLAPQLADQYHVVAPDLSGHGESGRREEYPRETWAREVMAVSAHAGMKSPPILIGHSLGGHVSIVAASLFGERLAGAIIVDSPVRRPDPESVEGARGRMFRNPKTYPDLETAIEHFHLVPPQPCENGFILRHVATHSLIEVDGGWTWKFDPRVFLNVTPTPMSEFLSSTRCRVGLLRGQLSDLVSPEIGAYMYELLDRNAPVVEIPQAHHHLLLDQPLAFLAAARALLADWEHSVPKIRAEKTQKTA
jgi:pimeloyl-ACP methyl ester carboxylesterase